MDSTTVLIDETGQRHLNVSNGRTSSHFIYVSISFNSSEKDYFEEARKDICYKYRLNDNLRGSNLRERDFNKRLQILDDLMKLNFFIDVLVIDKSRITSSALSYGRTFYKYFQATFVKKHFERNGECYVTAEKVGNEEFRKELENFIRNRSYEMHLFAPIREFNLVGKEVKLLQLVDFIANCVGKIFCASDLHDRASELWDRISSRTRLEYFPFIPEPSFTSSRDPEIDREIWKIGRELIKSYLDDQGKDEECKRVLMLLQTSSFINPSRFVPTYEIVEYMSTFYQDSSEEKVRRIIRDLRYEGLTIVSQSGRGGYKIATSYIDIYENVKHFMRYVEPMLQKLKVLNETISIGSHSKINPLEKDPSLALVRKLLQLI